MTTTTKLILAGIAIITWTAPMLYLIPKFISWAATLWLKKDLENRKSYHQQGENSFPPFMRPNQDLFLPPNANNGNMVIVPKLMVEVCGKSRFFTQNMDDEEVIKSCKDLFRLVIKEQEKKDTEQGYAEAALLMREQGELLKWIPQMMSDLRNQKPTNHA